MSELGKNILRLSRICFVIIILMKIAILGGSFDPPHIGHYWVTRQVLEHRPDIDQVLLVPAFKHQWKQIIASPEQRIAMLSEIEASNIKLSTVELERRGISYTVDTLREIKKASNATLYWVVGSDILSELNKWDKSEDMLQYASFLVFPRDPYLLPETLPRGFEALREPGLITSNISSTAIRERISRGLSIHTFVPEKIEEYITKYSLYR
jgi:nicotinate-nucleotide adenylyltransferase